MKREILNKLDRMITEENFDQALEIIIKYIEPQTYQEDYYKGKILFLQERDNNTWKNVLEKVLATSKENSDKLFEIKTYMELSFISIIEDDTKTALKQIEKAEAQVNKDYLSIDFDKEELIERIYHIKGMIYWDDKSVREALELKLKAIQYERKLSKNKILAWNLKAVGNIYSLLGQLDLAFDNYTESLEIAVKNDDKNMQVSLLTNLGYEYYFKKGNYDKALEMLREGEKIGKEINNWYYLIGLTYAQCYVHLNLHSPEYDRYYEKLTSIKLNPDSGRAGEVAHDFIQFLDALKLKNSKRIREKALGQEKLKNIISEKNLQFDVLVLGYYNLIDLLIDEYSLYEEKEVLDEIYNYINELMEFATRESAYNILIETTLLKGKLKIAEKKTSEASGILDEAEKIIDENKMNYLGEKIEKAKDEINTAVMSMNENIKLSTQEREELEKIQLKKYLQEAQKIIN